MSVRNLLVLLVSTSSLWAGEVHFVPGRPSSKGELVRLTEKELTWRDEANQTIVEPLQAVLGIDFQPAVPLPAGLKYTEVALTDGTLLHGSRIAIKGKEVELILAVSERVVQVPLNTIAYVLNDAHDPAIRQKWQEYLGKKRNLDLLAISRKGMLSTLEGTISGNDKGRIVFEYDGPGGRQKAELDPTKIQGMILLNSLGPQAPSAVCQVYDVNQNVLVADRVTADANGFTIRTVSGAKFEVPTAAIARLDYRSDKLVYLSDLKPRETVTKSKQGRLDIWRADKNLENSSLQLEGQVYGKGLCLHSHTELVYALDGKYKEFKAIVGMDDMVGGDGHPLVRVEGDGKELFSGAISRKDRRRELVLDIKGVKELRIIVTSSGLFDFGDHVDFADAKLQK
ncbi:MAG TPA: NPCBM/NEW2 domain-containing protein [Gemmataceae bacterium]|nr:NPCBM/NEW2 domain-containing protein [Gemmataceae bacterium]